MRSIIFSFLLGLGLLIAGCIPPKQVKQIESDNSSLRGQVDSLRAEMHKLRSLVARAEQSSQQSKEHALKSTADLNVRLEQMQQQMQIIDDRLDDMNNRVSNMPNKLRMVSERSTPPPAAANEEPAANTQTNNEPVADKNALAEMGKLYDASYQDLTQGKFELARQGFAEFLRRYPESALADNAQYWIGESYYSQREYVRASAEFAEVAEKYPAGDKVPASMLKRAYALISLSKRVEAKALLEKLIKQYPNTNEAELAKARLKE
ncbi:MAG: tol-pal system protein YbgF [candidate division KSB1 bacterium]